MDQYPTIQRIVEHGERIALAIALLPLAAALAACLLYGAPWAVLLAGGVTAAVVLFLMKAFVELVRVISDMLLPK